MTPGLFIACVIAGNLLTIPIIYVIGISVRYLYELARSLT